METYHPLAQDFLNFLNASVTPFHAVETSKQLLKSAGFQALSEKDKWNVKPGGKYFYTRNQSTIVAFVVGGKYMPGNGFNVVGAHTDSPNLRLKPNPEATREGFVQFEIEPYGGGLWTTWFDRDLTLAGRVVLEKEKGKFESVLFKIDRPILRIPTLAIHLDRDSGTKLEFNKQTQLFPILATSIAKQLGSEQIADGTMLSKILSNELKCEASAIRDFDICVIDTQPAAFGGLFNEFIFSGRLDNLGMSFCSLKALIEASNNSQYLSSEENVLVLALFDNEEVGSQSAPGAMAPILPELIHRITGSPELYEVAIHRSFFVSADMAHAVHPNYSDKHDPNHKPKIHGGVVIKANVNQRYATVAPTSFILREIARRNNLLVQDFVSRNDSPCGTTIGPIVSGNTGIRCVDIGVAQLSMHSIRETCGVADITHAVNLLRHFYQEFTQLDKNIKID
jgi:aspartyl aminopeptidase